MDPGLVSLNNASILSKQAGNSSFEFFLIASQPGHPPDAEKTLVTLLEEIHGRHPLQWLFTTCDPHHVYLTVEQKELDLDPYRAYSNAEVTAGIMQMLLDSGMCSAAFAFGVTSQPAVRVWPMDDWFGWALSRDSIRELSMKSIPLNLTLSPASGFIKPGMEELVEKLRSLLQLQLSYAEYIDLFGNSSSNRDFLRDIVDISSPAKVFQFLSSALASAHHFYDAMRLRTEAVVARAIEQMQKTSHSNAAMIVDVHFADLAELLFKERQISFVKLMPHGVTINSVLDASGEFLGVKHRNHKLEQLFSGETIRTEVELLISKKNDELNKERAQDWSFAGQGYSLKYEITRDNHARDMALKCLDRALELIPDYAHSLWQKGELYRLQGDRQRALELFDQIILSEPRDSTYWVSRAETLKEMGRKSEAYRSYLRAIHVGPEGPGPWTHLGLFLYYKGRKRAACYCFFKGKQLNGDESRQNFAMVCSKEPKFWDCPLSLQPFMIRLMNRFVLPVRYGWDKERLRIGLRVALIASLLTAVYGAFLGFRIAGLVGSVLGFFTLLFTSVALNYALFINATELSHRRFVKARELIMRSVCSLLGSVIGYNLASTLFSQRWLPLSSVALMLIGAAIGVSLWIPVRVLRHKWAPLRPSAKKYKA